MRYSQSPKIEPVRSPVIVARPNPLDRIDAGSVTSFEEYTSKRDATRDFPGVSLDESYVEPPQPGSVAALLKETLSLPVGRVGRPGHPLDAFGALFRAELCINDCSTVRCTTLSVCLVYLACRLLCSRVEQAAACNHCSPGVECCESFQGCGHARLRGSSSTHRNNLRRQSRVRWPTSPAQDQDDTCAVWLLRLR